MSGLFGKSRNTPELVATGSWSPSQLLHICFTTFHYMDQMLEEILEFFALYVLSQGALSPQDQLHTPCTEGFVGTKATPCQDRGTHRRGLTVPWFYSGFFFFFFLIE